MIFMNGKKYSQANIEFKSLLDQFSSTTFCDSAMYLMGQCLYNQSKYADAIEAWNQYRFRYTESMYAMEAVYGISLSWLQLKEYKKADNDLSKFLSSNSWYAEDEKIKLIGGLIDYYLGHYEDAAAKFKRLKNDVAYYYMGHSLLKLNKYPDAASAFSRIADEYKTSKYLESALYNKAESFYKGIKYDVAASAYKSFIDRFPTSKLTPYARLKRGSSLFMDKKYDLAIAEWEKGGGQDH
jgi:TolA-binding protein